MNLENKSVRQLGAYLNRLMINYMKIRDNTTYSDELRDKKETSNYNNTYAVCEIIENKIRTNENAMSDFNLNDAASQTIADGLNSFELYGE